ncbi:hypothetical protein [Bradyrhizobium sp. 162]|uniref:hypothetical protein n=1 Tax=Bradyrhizobium sp. 162 TaxID=2782635 RepID=UPI001FF74078|nr:hypothetical protein [Bradyrhizobium sp. 162]MCK1632642.1 hypothetical protein [Bradyrhizobium sp. 162]
MRFALIDGLKIVCAAASVGLPPKLFIDDCGQGECHRGWILSIIQNSNSVYYVTARFARYRADDAANRDGFTNYTTTYDEIEIVDCNPTSGGVTLQWRGEFVPLSQMGSHSTADEKSLWNAVCQNQDSDDDNE